MKKYALCILGGILTGAAFLSNNLFWLCFLAPSLLAYVLFSEERLSFMPSFLFGFFFFGINSSFLSSLDIDYISNPAASFVLPFLAWLLACLMEGFFIGLLGLLFLLLKRKTAPVFYPLLFSALYIFYEFIIGSEKNALGYSWGRLSVALSGHPVLIQTASLFGSLFVSFIIIYFASSLALYFLTKIKFHLIIALTLVFLNIIAGAVLSGVEYDGQVIKASAVQTGMGSEEKWGLTEEESINDVIKYADEADSSLIVYPEAGLPFVLNNTTYDDRLMDYSNKSGKALLVGSLYEKDSSTYTALYLFDSDKKYTYFKRHLVPFGEYVPGYNIAHRLFPTLLDNLYFTGALTPGLDSKPLNSKNLSLGCIVCFDSIFPSYTRETVSKGSNVLCISTNDSWFSGNAGEVHLKHSILRSVETGRYAIRSASTGISAIIDDKGHVLSRLERGKYGIITEKIKLITRTTPYVFWGDYPILIICFLFISLSLFKKIKS
ncbi:MAG: apolipoprotein N-acyltransferase, partial [Bacillota bacterium]|nr:apolipoprotein N-acyltransferase [Bacillota bacterium]